MITDKYFFNAVNNTNNVDFTGWDFSIIYYSYWSYG
ncbi:hypothetical protein DEU47_101144 [Bacillus sp. AG236]|nr:hypothetical protein DEU47_101144 [Bacillus sp. AG236]